MKPKHYILILISIFLFSCESNEPTIDSDNLLIGYWVEPVYNSDTVTFKRASSLPNQAYGISFSENNDFKERTSGWCGTPPLSFFDIDGNWLLENTLIKISTQSYPENYQWRVISLTENNLVVKRELTEQEKDHRNLMTLFNELENLVYSFSCTNENNWTFTSYGSKACGGSQGFIPYSLEMDTVSFLQKVTDYTEAERLYNLKWEIISTCDVPSQPINVKCKNGFPVLEY